MQVGKLEFPDLFAGTKNKSKYVKRKKTGTEIFREQTFGVRTCPPDWWNFRGTFSNLFCRNSSR